MNPSPSPAPGSPAGPPASHAPRKTRWPLYVLGGLLAFVLIVVASAAITLWWMQRPIKPVVLSPAEKAAVEEKLRALGGADANRSNAVASPAANALREAEANETPRAAAATDRRAEPAADRPYVPGSKVLRLTEREINGLLNANTDLGQNLRLEFGRDAINAYLAVPIPEDFPIGGGRMFRARGRFRVSLGNAGGPYAVLEDVTVFGLSLPKAWLGGLKGENLLGQAILGEGARPQGLPGVKSLRVEPGALVLEVED